MAKIAGSVWIEGINLHWVDENGKEWYFPGTLVASGSPGFEGSVWIEGDDLHYIDANDDERKVYGPLGSVQSALEGSAWVQSVTHLISWITESTLKNVSAHDDTAHEDDHGDETYSDHGDVPHSDSHTDTAHGDEHGDVPHSDSHTDEHGDEYYDHTDHTDGPGHADVDPHADAHSDVPHSDTSHTDTHTDDAHGDVAHGDHTDSHTDNTAHVDLPVYVG